MVVPLYKGELNMTTISKKIPRICLKCYGDVGVVTFFICFISIYITQPPTLDIIERLHNGYFHNKVVNAHWIIYVTCAQIGNLRPYYKHSP